LNQFFEAPVFQSPSQEQIAEKLKEAGLNKSREKFDEDGKLILDCRICPYSRVSPCIGYCIARLYREMKEGKSIVREGAEEPH
jgi:hypothetical protein